MTLHTKKSECVSYFKTGSAFAEKLLGTNSLSERTVVNLTMYERKDGEYNLHYCSLPFRGYHHAVMFSSEQLVAMDIGSSSRLLVDDKHFSTLPFLSNSVQQFSMWLQSANRILGSKLKSKISFTFDSSHALTFFYELENSKSSFDQRFDLIYTSRSFANVILSTISLLKKGGLLFTTTLSLQAFKTTELLLEACFGFESKLLPVVLGIRCINHEGGDYSNHLIIQPPSLSLSMPLSFKESTLIWERLDDLPLVFPRGQHLSGPIADALCGAALVSAYSLLKSLEGLHVTVKLSIETAIKMIQVFMSNAVAEYDIEFWEPLCALLRKKMKPFLLSMQTQLSLHGIHMHLTVTSENCHLCQQQPLSSNIGLFCARVYASSNFFERFMIFVHKRATTFESLCDVALQNGADVHIFDCLSSASDNTDSDKLYFYAPLKLLNQGYKVTVYESRIINWMTSNNLNRATETDQTLQGKKIPFSSFKFFQPSLLRVYQIDLGSFGKISSHLSDGDISRLNINFSEMKYNSLVVNKHVT